MKPFYIFTVVFFLIGICSVTAQDLIILKNGDMIKAKVSEISPTEIRYKRFEHLDGPTIVIPASTVLSIRYEDGNYDIINAGTVESPITTALDPDKFIFAFNINSGGFLFSYYPGGGPSLCLEFGKGNFNTEINLIYPIGRVGPMGGFGGLITFNYFWHNWVGGFYLGGAIGYLGETWDGYYHFPLGLNIGYKFVTPSGVYFRTGFCGGPMFGNYGVSAFIIPDFSIGYCFK